MLLTSPPGRPPFVAHISLMLLAALSAVAVQTAWPSALKAAGTIGWWPYVVAVLVATTAWLFSAGWLHWRLAHWQADDPLQRLMRLLMNAVSDFLVWAIAAMTLFKGPESRMLLAGLWIVPPTLMAVAAASIVVLSLAMIRIWPEVRQGRAAGKAPPKARDRWRTVIVLALFVSLGMLSAQPLPRRPKRSAAPPLRGYPIQSVMAGHSNSSKRPFHRNVMGTALGTRRRRTSASDIPRAWPTMQRMGL
jgi:hypothetical protein